MDHEVLITEIDMAYSPQSTEYLLILYYREGRKKKRLMLRTRNNIMRFVGDQVGAEEYSVLSINKRLKKMKGFKMVLRRTKDNLKIFPNEDSKK